MSESATDELDATIVDHSDDDFGDDEPMDVGAAMGDHTGTEPTDADAESAETDDETEYPSLVANAAHGLYEGYLTWADVELPADIDVEWEQFETDVEEKREDIADRREIDGGESERVDEQADPSIDGVDWDALWSEFGFDSEDANGDVYASKTQLTAALESFDQNISSAQTHIQQAVEGEELHKLTGTGEHGETLVRGYARTAGGRDE